MASSTFDTFLQNLARVIARVLYRSVDVHDPDPSWSDRPAILVANHFGGFADPALLIGVLAKPPRFLAKATLWDVGPVGPLLELGGAIPVYRASDGATSGNRDTFAACYRALAAGEQIALFPEGTTHDDPSMTRLKTGAARIAMGAMAAGVPAPVVVPVGIHYEDKAAIRSRAAVIVGAPIEVSAVVGHADPSDRDAVHRLTEVIDERLRSAAPDFRTWKEAHLLGTAAEVALGASSLGGSVGYAPRERLAGLLGRAPEPDRSAVSTAVGRYLDAVEAAGMEGPGVRPSALELARRAVRSLAVTLLLAPFALAGVALNVVPYLLTRLVGRLSAPPVTLATVKVLVGLVAFVGTWTFWAWVVASRWGWRFGSAMFVLAPFYGGVAIAVWERLGAFWRLFGSLRRSEGGLDAATAAGLRDDVVRAVEAALVAAGRAVR